MKNIILGLLLSFCLTSVGFAQGYDDPLTPGIDEGAIGSGYDNPLTKDVNEGKIGSDHDDTDVFNFSEGVEKGMESYLENKRRKEDKARYDQEQASLQKLRDLQQEQIRLEMELARAKEARDAQEAARQEQLWSPGGPEQRTVPGAGAMTGRGAEYTTQKPAGLLYQQAQLELEQKRIELEQTNR